MNKKDLKNKIKTSFQEETPNNLDISERCKEIAQDQYVLQELDGTMAVNRKNWVTYSIISLAFILVLVAGAFLGKLFPIGTAKAYSSVYVDVNPSIELRLDKDKIVLDCTAGNDDAVIVIGDMQLKGMPLNTAINALIGSMYLNGYLSGEQNSILLSVDTDDQNIDVTLNDLVSDVNNVFNNSEIKCSVIAQPISKNQFIHDHAKEHNVSLGKMSLIEKIIENQSSEYTETDREQLAKLSVHELSLIYSSLFSENTKPEQDGIISGEVNGFTDRQSVLNTVLTDLGVSEDQVEHFNMRPTFEHHDDTHNMIYDVIVILKDDSEYHYFVDCKNGSILDRFDGDFPPEHSPDDEHKPPQDDHDAPPKHEPPRP